MPRDKGRIEYVSRKMVWRVVLYVGKRDVTIGEYPTRDIAVARLQEIIQSARAETAS